MPTRIGINGFGRIGRQSFTAMLENHPGALEVVAINDLFDTDEGLDTGEYPRALYAPHPILSGMISRDGLVRAAVELAATTRGMPLLRRNSIELRGVDSAESAEAAIDYLSSNRPDVIFMDHLMPGMDGFETDELIRQRDRSRHNPLLCLTAYQSTYEQLQRRYAPAPVDFLNNPVLSMVLRSKFAVFVDLFRRGNGFGNLGPQHVPILLPRSMNRHPQRRRAARVKNLDRSNGADMPVHAAFPAAGNATQYARARSMPLDSGGP